MPSHTQYRDSISDCEAGNGEWVVEGLYNKALREQRFISSTWIDCTAHAENLQSSVRRGETRDRGRNVSIQVIKYRETSVKASSTPTHRRRERSEGQKKSDDPLNAQWFTLVQPLIKEIQTASTGDSPPIPNLQPNHGLYVISVKLFLYLNLNQLSVLSYCNHVSHTAF